MSRFVHLKNNFLAGEVSPKIYGRTELPEHQQGAAQFQNFLSNVTGGASFRPGSQLAGQLLGLTGTQKYVRIIPFVFSKTESYVICLIPGVAGVTIYRNDGTLCTVTGGTYISSAAITTTNLHEWQYVQSADVLTMVHSSWAPITISRTASLTFVIGQYFAQSIASFNQRDVLRYPYRDANTSGTTIAPSAVGTPGAAITLTASTGIFDAALNGHDGTFWKITHAGVTGVARITSVSSPTVANAKVYIPFAANSASSDWREMAWSDYRGWPRTITLFEGRLIYGGNTAQPDTVWASRLSAYTTMMAEKLPQDLGSDSTGFGYYGVVTDSDAFTFTLASSEINAIQWMASTSTLCIGTLGGEYIANAGQNSVLSARNPSFVPQTNMGGSYVKAQRVGNSILFVSRDGKRLIEFAYDPYGGAYKSRDLLALSDHLPHFSRRTSASFATSQILEFSYQPSRGIVWVLLRDVDQSRSVLAVTVDKDRKVLSWSRQILGGTTTMTDPADSSTYTSVPYVTGLTVIPNSTGTSDEVWFHALRDFGGTQKNILEKIGIDFTGAALDNTSTNVEDKPLYVDCAAFMTSGSPTQAWTSSVHSNVTLTVLADGKPVGTVTTDGAGNFTIPLPAKQVIAGFGYRGLIQMLPVEAGAQLGSASAAIQRFDQAAVRFYNTVGAKHGSSLTNLQEMNFPQGKMGAATPLFTGVIRLPFPGGYSDDATYYLVQDQPLPMNIVSVTLRGNTNDA
jgi:hypothetical protein